MAVAVKVGPWGAPGGDPRDISIGSKPQSLVSVTIYSFKALGGAICGLSFVYVDQNEEPIHVGPWGYINPEHTIMTKIELGPGEYVYDMSGTFNDAALYSLRLVTNQGNEYTTGNPEVPLTQSFSVPLENGKVVAFFGRFDDTPGAVPSFKAIGIYVAPVRDWPVKIGPWGGPGGIRVDIPTTPVQLKSVTVYSTDSDDGRINGFFFTYIDLNGDLIHVGPWGPINGEPHAFDLDQGEYVNDITGTFDDGGVTSLKFTTNQGGVYGPFGRERGTAFSVPLPDDRHDNGAMVGFFGRSGESLVALGVYVGLAPKP